MAQIDLILQKISWNAFMKCVYVYVGLCTYIVLLILYHIQVHCSFFPHRPAVSPDFHCHGGGWAELYTHTNTRISSACSWEILTVPDRNCIHHPATPQAPVPIVLLGTRHLSLHVRITHCIAWGQDGMIVQPYCSWVMGKGTGVVAWWRELSGTQFVLKGKRVLQRRSCYICTFTMFFLVILPICLSIWISCAFPLLFFFSSSLFQH